jgi:flagellum-specific peptidoglycan hydrolase FlgJ
MKEWIRDIIIVLAIFILGLIVGLNSQHNNKESKQLDKVYYNVDSNNVSKDLYFEKHKIRFSHIVYAQATLESNNFKSKLCKENNNIFGMKVPAQRFTFCNNPYDYGNYAKYDNIESCILDYKAWQMQNAYNITTEEGYFNLLRNIYAEDTEYVNKLKKIINGNKSKNN